MSTTGTAASAATSKSQKHFDQLRRLVLKRNPDLDEIRALVEKDPTCVQFSDSQHGLTALHWSCVFQCPLSIVQFLVETWPPALSLEDGDGRTPLHHACRPEGRVDVVAYLLEQSSNKQSTNNNNNTANKLVTLRDHRGKTPLHCACAELVPTQMVQLLLQANPAAAKIRTREGLTPLQHACDYQAPPSTIRVLVDAYPEAVKYLPAPNQISNAEDDEYEEDLTSDVQSAAQKLYTQAKNYLAYKVKQMEEEAVRKAAEEDWQRQQEAIERNSNTKSGNNNKKDRVMMRRRMEPDEEEFGGNAVAISAVSGEYDTTMVDDKEHRFHNNNSVAQQQKQQALERLQQDQMDMEKKAAELDRLIQQKESLLETERFQKETERLFGNNKSLPPPTNNDSGIGRSRSFDARPQSTNNQRPASRNAQSQPRPERHEHHYSTDYRNNNSPGGGGYSGEDSEDEELFDSLRNSANTKGLYPESNLQNGLDTSSWMISQQQQQQQQETTVMASGSKYGKGPIRDASPAPPRDIMVTQQQQPQHYPTRQHNDTEDPIMRNRKDTTFVDPVMRNRKDTTIGMDDIPTNDPNPSGGDTVLQAQLERALRLLEETEERREQELQEQKEQQETLQQELGMLMEKLAMSEKVQRQHEEQQQQRIAAALAASRDPGGTHIKGLGVTETASSSRMKQPPGTNSFGQVSTVDSKEPSSPKQSKGPAQSTPLQKQKENFHKNRNSVTNASSQEEQRHPAQEEHRMKDGAGMTPLHVACANGASYTVLQLLLAQFPVAIYQTDCAGNTVLHHACSCPSTVLENFQLLLDIFPAAVLMTNQSGETPLHVACKHHAQRLEVVQLLVDTSNRLEEEIAAAKDAVLSLREQEQQKHHQKKQPTPGGGEGSTRQERLPK